MTHCQFSREAESDYIFEFRFLFNIYKKNQLRRLLFLLLSESRSFDTDRVLDLDLERLR